MKINLNHMFSTVVLKDGQQHGSALQWFLITINTL